MEGVAAQTRARDHGHGSTPRADARSSGSSTTNAAASPSCMPLRPRSKGRQTSGLIALERAKPSSAIRENGSTPPATATSTAPDAHRRGRRADRIVPRRAGRPVRPLRATERRGGRDLGGEDAPCGLGRCPAPPLPPRPRRLATRPSSCRRRRRPGRPSGARRCGRLERCAGASRASARPRRVGIRLAEVVLDPASARAPGSPRRRDPASSRLAVSPARSRAQSSFGSEPSGVRTPIPVTTTRPTVSPAVTSAYAAIASSVASCCHSSSGTTKRKRYSSLATNSTTSSESSPSSLDQLAVGGQLAGNLRVHLVQLGAEDSSISPCVVGTAALTRQRDFAGQRPGALRGARCVTQRRCRVADDAVAGDRRVVLLGREHELADRRAAVPSARVRRGAPSARSSGGRSSRRRRRRRRPHPAARAPRRTRARRGACWLSGR